jgi:hypothetical protein
MVFGGACFTAACPWDDHLREFLSTHFWLPFAKYAADFERPHIRRANAPFAGMAKVQGGSALENLRKAYQQISHPPPYPLSPEPPPDFESLQKAVAAARKGPSLTPHDREEIDLIEAKIEMRSAGLDDPELLQSAKQKFERFLRTARTPEFLSEARGWLAHIYYVSGDQTTAGKMYLDELNRTDSNLGRETLLNSLHMTYGYDGGPGLLAHLDEYFDTPEHAAFAIQLVTNPHWRREIGQEEPEDNTFAAYGRVMELLAKHEDLLRTGVGSDALALLTMRTALRMGDPPNARKVAESVPSTATIRTDPDFLWMHASALFLSHDYAAAERALLALFRSPRAESGEHAAAAYGLCGVYWKTGNAVEQLRFALWLHAVKRGPDDYASIPPSIADLGIYWASSGWDLGMLLDAEAPLDAMRKFIDENTKVADLRLVKYSLAVRLSRVNRYREAAELYQSVGAFRRAARMRQLASLYEKAAQPDLPLAERSDAQFRLAEYLSANVNRIYFNDALWGGMQRYAFQASVENRLTRSEREAMIARERKLKDDQEELWRAYLILRDVVRDSGHTPLGRKAATLAITSLRRISERFERAEEIHKADTDLSNWLRR